MKNLFRKLIKHLEDYMFIKMNNWEVDHRNNTSKQHQAFYSGRYIHEIYGIGEK